MGVAKSILARPGGVVTPENFFFFLSFFHVKVHRQLLLSANGFYCIAITLSVLSVHFVIN